MGDYSSLPPSHLYVVAQAQSESTQEIWLVNTKSDTESVMPVLSRHRKRSSSDPFSDPTLAFGSAPPPVPPNPKRSANRRDTMDALRDTVIVRNHDSNPRNKMGRSHTQGPQQISSNGRPSAHMPRRSLSQDDPAAVVAAPPEKIKPGKTRVGKKGSQHADVIDRLDFSGVGPMFHHDGPFDACAPSRNRHRTKAPMAAWSVAPDGSAPIPVTTAAPRAQVYRTEPMPRRKVDAIAEAWGIHEPEPFEDFSAGGGDYRQNYSPANTLAKRNDDISAPNRRQPPRRTILPPPQPIFVPGPDEDIGGPPSPNSGSPGTGMRRSRSLMHRIRKMRETPNIPVNNDDSPNDDYAAPPSPNDATGTRPTHRSQNSFLGRFGRSGNTNGVGTPPADNEPYVYIDDPKYKELPKPPSGSSGASSENGVNDYFDSNHGSFGGSPSSGVLGRKQSLLKKVGKVVKGQK